MIGNGQGESGCQLHNPGYDFNDDCLGRRRQLLGATGRALPGLSQGFQRARGLARGSTEDNHNDRTLGSIALSLLPRRTGRRRRLDRQGPAPGRRPDLPAARIQAAGRPPGELRHRDRRSPLRGLRARCEWVESNWDGIIPALLSRKIDAIVSSMTITPKRAQHIAFTDRVSNAPSRLVVRRGSALLPDAEACAASAWGRPGLQPGGLRQGRMGRQGVRVVYQNQDQVYADLVMGRLDASLQGAVQASYGFPRQAGRQGFRTGRAVLDDPRYFGVGDGIGLRKGGRGAARGPEQGAGDDPRQRNLRANQRPLLRLRPLRHALNGVRPLFTSTDNNKQWRVKCSSTASARRYSPAPW